MSRARGETPPPGARPPAGALGADGARDRPPARARAEGGWNGRLVLSTLLGAGSACAAVGLLATSAWLIAPACSSSRSRARYCATASG
jgi:hypothetical protein